MMTNVMMMSIMVCFTINYNNNIILIHMYSLSESEVTSFFDDDDGGGVEDGGGIGDVTLS